MSSNSLETEEFYKYFLQVDVFEWIILLIYMNGERETQREREMVYNVYAQGKRKCMREG